MYKNDFINRYNNFAYNQVMTLFRIMKGISLGAFGYVTILNISKFGTTFNNESVLIYVLILTDFLLMMVIYDGSMFGSLFASKIPKAGSTLSTFLMAVFEYLVIFVLIPDKNIDHSLWFLFYSIIGIITSFVIFNEAINKNKFEMGEDDFMDEVLKIYQGDEKITYRISFISGLIFLVFYIINRFFISNKHTSFLLQIIFSIIAFAIMFASFIFQHLGREKVRKRILELSSNK